MSTRAESTQRRTQLERARLGVQVTLGVLALAAIIWFAVANSQRVTVDWFSVETSTPLFVVIVVSGVLGALIGRALQWRSSRRR